MRLVILLFFILSHAFGANQDLIPSVSRQRDLLAPCNELFRQILKENEIRKIHINVFYDQDAMKNFQKTLIQDPLLAFEFGWSMGLDFVMTADRFSGASKTEGRILGVEPNQRNGSEAYDLILLKKWGEKLSVPFEDIKMETVSVRHDPIEPFIKDTSIPLSEVATRSGINSFLHMTKNLNTLEGILKAGNLLSMSSGIYFVANVKGKRKFNSFYGQILLELENSILDTQEHYFNPVQSYGEFSVNSILSNDTFYYRRVLNALGFGYVKSPGEFVFKRDISTQHLKGIGVKEGKKKDFIKELNEKGILGTKDGRKLESLVFELD